jgi:hypothetical protein
MNLVLLQIVLRLVEERYPNSCPNKSLWNHHTLPVNAV